MKAKRWILVKHFDGFPKDSDFKLIEEELPAIQKGEVLLEGLFLSLDPYMRPFSTALSEGDTFFGQQVSRVVESQDANYPVGQLVLAMVGWRSHTIVNPSKNNFNYLFNEIEKMPDIGELSPSYGLGVLGLTGGTAYFGIRDVLRPKAGETMLVNSAAGAVGSTAIQIAKIKGCRVLGCAGSEDKCSWIKNKLGADYVFNYKTQKLDDALKEGAPDGIDCYFDNVGGIFTHTVIENHMKDGGRIGCCGTIDGYNDKEPKLGPYPYRFINNKQLKLEGIMYHRWTNEWDVFVKECAQWIREGKLKTTERVTEGIENTPKAFYGLLRGEGTGKAIVKF